MQLQRDIAVAGSQLETCRQTLELRDAAAALAQSVQPLNAAYSRIAAGAVRCQFLRPFCAFCCAL